MSVLLAQLSVSLQQIQLSAPRGDQPARRVPFVDLFILCAVDMTSSQSVVCWPGLYCVTKVGHSLMAVLPSQPPKC